MHGWPKREEVIPEVSTLYVITKMMSENAKNGEERKQFKVALDSLQEQIKLLDENPGEIEDWTLETRLRFWANRTVDPTRPDDPNMMWSDLMDASAIVADYKAFIEKVGGDLVDDDRVS